MTDTIEFHTRTALYIGNDDFLKNEVSNRLNLKFSFDIITKDSIDEGVKSIKENKIQLLVVDIDNTKLDSTLRLEQIVNHFEIPCLLISNDKTLLNKLRMDMDNSFFSFLPKEIVNVMFDNTLNLLLDKTKAPSRISKRIIEVGTSKKTKLMYALATLLICEPLIKIIYLKFQTGFDWEILMRTIFSIEGIINNFEFWALFPLAGYALISMKSWSFPFFIALQIYALYSYFTYEKFTWPYVDQTPHISVTFLLMFNSLLVFYFMIPANLRPFWSRMRRIWRNTSRYSTSLHAQIRIGQDKKINTLITNLSEGGAFFTLEENLPLGQRLKIDITVDKKKVNLDAIIRRAQLANDEIQVGYGVEFKYKSKEEKNMFTQFVQNLKQV